MYIYLIRHGDKYEEYGNRDLLELTEKGYKQAELLGKRLSRYNIEKIYSSKMVRAVQTSETINKYLNVGIAIRTDLREIDMGECEVKGWEYVKENYPYFMEEFLKHKVDIPYPKGECGRDVWERSIKVIKEITSSDLNNVAVVTHAGVIRVLISGFLGLAQQRRFYIGFPPENCSISIIKYDKSTSEFYVHSVNDYAHLEKLVGEEVEV